MYQPLEHVKLNEDAQRWSSWRCRVPHCGGQHEGDGLCEFHRKFAGRQLGSPFNYDPEEIGSEQARQLYAVHIERERGRVVYHLIMALLWPGPTTETRIKNARREKALRLKWEEENDR